MAQQRTKGRHLTALTTDVSRLQAAFLDCHSEGHQWKHQPGRIDPIQAEPGMRAPFMMTSAVGRRSLCTSCTSERIRWYSRSGEVINRYRYAEGYLHKKRSLDDEPAPTRLEWRQRLVLTLFDEDLSLTPARRTRKRASA